MIISLFKKKKSGENRRARTLDLVSSGDRHNKIKDWAAAAQFYREALRKDGTLVHIWVQLGHMEKELGNPEAAIAAYRMALSQDSTDTDAARHLAFLLKRQGNLIEAYNLFESIYRKTGEAEIEAQLREVVGISKPYDQFIAALDKQFDQEFYLEMYQDVHVSGVEPRTHFIVYGWKEGRQSRPLQYNARTNPFDRIPMSSQSSERVAISVVMPTFNRAKLLETTLRSLLSTIKNDPVEIIVIDDGSTDETPDVLTSLAYQHPKLRFQSIKNSGPGHARNLGASLSKGDVILFLGDDTRPVDSDLFRAHYEAHAVSDDLGHTVLGKIIWPDEKEMVPNAVMSLIQGDGQQQFGYKFMKPWQKYSPWLFYTANVSVKRGIVKDWLSEGFDRDFTLYGFEDSEFAYRMSKKHESFGVFYTPNAIVQHHHNYNVAGFIRRQASCGLMIDVLLRKHPELETLILGPDLPNILRSSQKGFGGDAPTHHYSTMIEGIRAWALVIDHHHGIGSQNWHPDFLSAVFRISLLDSYIMLRGENPGGQAAAYRYLLTDFRVQMGRAIASELLGDAPLNAFI